VRDPERFSKVRESDRLRASTFWTDVDTILGTTDS